MAEILLVWLLLAFPGFVLWRRLWPEELDCGFLGVVAISYLATFALLSPLNLIAYWLELPLWFFSFSCIAMVVFAVFYLIWKGWWRECFSSRNNVFIIGLFYLSFYLYNAAVRGTYIVGDARFHLARIRFIFSAGFSNADPYVGDYFTPIYHTNIFHALLAGISQITDKEILDVWYYSLPWSKLVIASGVYYLAFEIFRRHWAGWLSAIWLLAHFSFTDFSLYPNHLAPYWLVSIGLAFALRGFIEQRRPVQLIKLAACSLVIAQVHSLYSVFLGVAVGAGAFLLAVWEIYQRRPGWKYCLGCLLSLSVASPFPIYSVYVRNTNQEKQLSGPTQVIEEKRDSGEGKQDTECVAIETKATKGGRNRFLTGIARADEGSTERFDNDKRNNGKRHKRKKDSDTSSAYWLAVANIVANPFFLLVAFAIGIAGRFRNRVAVLLCNTVGIAVLLWVPEVREMATTLAGREWIVNRIGSVVGEIRIALVPGVVFYGLLEQRQWVSVKFAILMLAISILGIRTNSYGANQGSCLIATEKLVKGKPGRKKRAKQVRSFRRYARFIRRAIPAGSGVLEPEVRRGEKLAIAQRIRLVYARHSSGVPNRRERRRDMSQMLRRSTNREKRLELFRKYDVRYFTCKKRKEKSYKWIYEYGEPVGKGKFETVVRLNWSHE